MGDTITITDPDGVTRTFEAGGPGQPIIIPPGAIKPGSDVTIRATLTREKISLGAALCQPIVLPACAWEQLMADTFAAQARAEGDDNG